MLDPIAKQRVAKAHDDGLAKYFQGDFRGAIADYDTAISALRARLARYPDVTTASDADIVYATALELRAWADAHLQLEDDEWATDCVAWISKCALICIDRGNAKIRLEDDYEGATADYEIAIAINPFDYGAQYEHSEELAGRLFAARGIADAYLGIATIKGRPNGRYFDFEGAIAAQNRARALDPGSIWIQMGRDIDLNPDSRDAYYNSGNAKRRAKDHAGAIADYGQCIAIDPEFESAYINRCASKCELGDFDGAIADCDLAIALNSGRATPYQNRGFAKFSKGDHHGAIEDYDRAIAMEPNYAIAYRNRANAKEALGDINGANADRNTATNLRGQVFMPLSQDSPIAPITAESAGDDGQIAGNDEQPGTDHQPKTRGVWGWFSRKFRSGRHHR